MGNRVGGFSRTRPPRVQPRPDRSGRPCPWLAICFDAAWPWALLSPFFLALEARGRGLIGPVPGARDSDADADDDDDGDGDGDPATSPRAAVASLGVAAGAAGWGGPKGNSVWAGIAGAGRPVTKPGSGRLGPPASGAGLDGAGAGPAGVTRSRSLSLWLRSPEPGTGEPAAYPSTMAARWSRDSRSVVMMSESTASEPVRIFSRTASMPCVNRAIGSSPTIAAAPL